MGEVAKTFDQVNFDRVNEHAKALLEECPEFDDVMVLVNWKKRFRDAELPVCTIQTQEENIEDPKHLTIQTTLLCRLLRKIEETLMEKEAARIINFLREAYSRIEILEAGLKSDDNHEATEA